MRTMLPASTVSIAYAHFYKIPPNVPRAFLSAAEITDEFVILSQCNQLANALTVVTNQ